MPTTEKATPTSPRDPRKPETGPAPEKGKPRLFQDTRTAGTYEALTALKVGYQMMESQNEESTVFRKGKEMVDGATNYLWKKYRLPLKGCANRLIDHYEGELKTSINASAREEILDGFLGVLGQSRAFAKYDPTKAKLRTFLRMKLCSHVLQEMFKRSGIPRSKRRAQEEAGGGGDARPPSSGPRRMGGEGGAGAGSGDQQEEEVEPTTLFSMDVGWFGGHLISAFCALSDSDQLGAALIAFELRGERLSEDRKEALCSRHRIEAADKSNALSKRLGKAKRLLGELLQAAIAETVAEAEFEREWDVWRSLKGEEIRVLAEWLASRDWLPPEAA